MSIIQTSQWQKKKRYIIDWWLMIEKDSPAANDKKNINSSLWFFERNSAKKSYHRELRLSCFYPCSLLFAFLRVWIGRMTNFLRYIASSSSKTWNVAIRLRVLFWSGSGGLVVLIIIIVIIKVFVFNYFVLQSFTGEIIDGTRNDL